MLPQKIIANELGPGSSNNYIMSNELITFMQRCERYVTDLPLFSQYCVWRYTIGSATINNKQIFGEIGNRSNAVRWVYLFFKYWNNTAVNYRVNVDDVPGVFAGYKVYFRNPEYFMNLDDGKVMVVVNEVVDKYSAYLQNIIMSGPKVEGEGIDVYKVSGKYPDLPNDNPNEFTPKAVLQLPFNSTSINPHFNFALFVGNPENECCLFQLHIPNGMHVLYIPSLYHAYPFENEIILPMGVTFYIGGVSKGELYYVNPNEVNIDVVQNKRGIRMGPVYEINEYKPGKYGEVMIQKRPFNIFNGVIG